MTAQEPPEERVADVLQRGLVGDDASIVQEIADLSRLMWERRAWLSARDPVGAVGYGDLLGDVANRLLDIQGAINERYLAASEVGQARPHGGDDV